MSDYPCGPPLIPFGMQVERRLLSLCFRHDPPLEDLARSLCTDPTPWTLDQCIPGIVFLVRTVFRTAFIFGILVVIIMGRVCPQSPCFHWVRWMPHRHHEISLAENTPCHHCLGLDNIHLRAVEDYNLYKISFHNIGSSCLQGGSLYTTCGNQACRTKTS